VPVTRSQELKVPACPRCGNAHDFAVSIHTRTLSTVPIYFGGKTVNAKTWDVILTCPVQKNQFTKSIQVTPLDGEQILSVEMQGSGSDIRQVDKSGDDPLDREDWLRKELADRIKASPQSAQDFSKTMISTASGAIAIYFAISKFLGVEVSGEGRHLVRVVPPVLFLFSTVILILAIRPSLISLGSAVDYGTVREARLRRLARLMDSAMWIFFAGLAIACTVWVFKL
jgi:hypothetical protein